MSKTLFESSQWPFIQQLQKSFPKGGFYLVGGAVRDALLKRTPKDIDFVVTGVPLKDLTAALEKSGEVNLVGKRFGVIKFKPDASKTVYDIALPRKEFSLSFSGAYRDFSVQSDPDLPIEEDLARRDFTINAMAYDLSHQQLIDPFLGQKDLDEKIIRTVGSAVTRFQEDYSRMLRAVRFSCQLDFSLTEKISTTLQKLAPHLNDTIDEKWIVSRETISQELLKALDADPITFLHLYNKHHLFDVLIPEISELKNCDQTEPYHLEGNVFNHIEEAFKAAESKTYQAILPGPLETMAKIGILFHDIGKPLTASTDKKGQIHFYGHAQKGAELAGKICSRLQLGSTEYFSFKCKSLVWMIRHHLFSIDDSNNPVQLTELENLFFSKSYPSKALLQLMLADLMGSLTNVRDATAPIKKLLERLEKIAPDGKLPDPLLNGDEVMKRLNLEPGPDVQKALLLVREEQLQGRLETEGDALSFLTQHQL